MPQELKGRLRDLAQYFLARRGRFISREQLLLQVFDYPSDAKTRTIDTHIQRLLGVLGDSEEILVIRSRHRHGYMLAARPGAEL
jgi:DNA-binding response OmpR family regulator